MMERGKVTDEVLRQKMEQLGNAALDELRRRGVTEAEIQEMLARKRQRAKRRNEK